ncbi:MAG: methylated-DNA--[protein]-cysteine S-methyltransferase [Bdellovibrionaceae bacterium]|nr:methylated-DNA--[protein]-cysteine S-methyltransferase [Bdellovibrionales bacterium]MCB9254385.1 methylated-DNA--[protein]-cysteine S-methyltransferase [Pseudobdellovibrionaceae bacterium]
MKYTNNILQTPIGKISVYACEDGLREIRFQNHKKEPLTDLHVDALKQLEEYFAGTRQIFELPLSLTGTDFQVRVWDSLRVLGFGETTNYGSIAHSVGSPRASRAVGNAVGRNPLPIVIPCHRVIHAGGGIGGFSGGLSKKRWLLNHETFQFPTSRRDVASLVSVGI